MAKHNEEAENQNWQRQIESWSDAEIKAQLAEMNAAKENGESAEREEMRRQLAAEHAERIQPEKKEKPEN